MASQFEDLDIDYMRKRASEENPNLLSRLEKEYAWVKNKMTK